MVPDSTRREQGAPSEGGEAQPPRRPRSWELAPPRGPEAAARPGAPRGAAPPEPRPSNQAAGSGEGEWFDDRVARPLGRRLARALHRAGLTANQVTGLGALAGLGAGLALAQGGRVAALGSLLLVVMLVLDCADGEVARLSGPSDAPWRGRVIDGLADALTGVAVHLGMLVGLTRVGLAWDGHPVPFAVLFLVAAAAGVSLTWNAGVVDDVKQRLSPRSVDRELARYAGQPRTWLDRFLFAFLRRYVASIARYTGATRPGGARLYRRAQWVGMTHHYLAIAAAGLLVASFPTAYFTYFALAIGPANAYLVYVLWRERRVGAAASHGAV